jgi:hypothetical protein
MAKEAVHMVTPPEIKATNINKLLSTNISLNSLIKWYFKYKY